jgi:hypothetical protein
MSQVSLVPVTNVDQFWPSLRAGFERALKKTGGDLTSGDLWVTCRSGAGFLLIAHEGEEILGASIWRQDTWDSGRKLRCLAMYGNRLREWKDDMRASAIRVMRDCGATSLVSEGRCGKNGEPLWTKPYPNAKPLRILYEEVIE